MPFDAPTFNTDLATYSGECPIADGDTDSTKLLFTLEFIGEPVSHLTEGERDDLFQDLVDFVATYPRLNPGLSASKSYTGAEACTPTEEESV